VPEVDSVGPAGMGAQGIQFYIECSGSFHVFSIQAL